MNFRLLGYDNPSGYYPSPVVPVGVSGNEIGVVFRNENDEASFEAIDAASVYLRFDEAQLRDLRAFDADHDGLFALAEDRVVRYRVAEEPQFFDDLLSDSHMAADDPFFRLSLAQAARSREALLDEFLATVRVASAELPAYVDRWYAEAVETLKASDPAGYRDWPDSPSAIVPFVGEQDAVVRSGHMVLHGVARAYERTSRLLEDLLRNVSRSRSLALAGAVESLLGRCGLRTARIAFVGPDYATGGILRELGVMSPDDERVRFFRGVAVDKFSTSPDEGADVVVTVSAESGSGFDHAAEMLTKVSRERATIRLNLPESAERLTRFQRLRSGMKRLEEAVARTAKETVLRPALRDDIRGAIEIGRRHLAALRRFERLDSDEATYGVKRTAKLAAEVETRLANFLSREREREARARNVIEGFWVRCLASLEREVSHWQWPSSALWLFPWRKRLVIEDDIERLLLRCRRIVEEHGRQLDKALLEIDVRFVPRRRWDEALLQGVSLNWLEDLPRFSLDRRKLEGLVRERVLSSFERFAFRDVVEEIRRDLRHVAANRPTAILLHDAFARSSPMARPAVSTLGRFARAIEAEAARFKSYADETVRILDALERELANVERL